MLIQESPETTAALYDHIRKEVDQDRPGWHYSDFLYCDYKTWYRKRGIKHPMSDDQVMLFYLGHCIQYMLHPIKQADAKTCEIDGITMTPDIEDAYFGGVRIDLGEMKSTRASSAWFKPENYPHYLQQIEGYAWPRFLADPALEAITAHLIIFFVTGDYKPPFPKMGTWTVKITRKEAEENWAMILHRKAILEPAVATDAEPAEFWQAFGKECSYCEYSLGCTKFHEDDTAPKGRRK